MMIWRKKSRKDKYILVRFIYKNKGKFKNMIEFQKGIMKSIRPELNYLQTKQEI